MYTCNDVVEFHANQDDKDEFLKVFNSKAEFKVYGSWEDPTCYLYRTNTFGITHGGWLIKQGYSIENAIKFLFDNKNL